MISIIINIFSPFPIYEIKEKRREGKVLREKRHCRKEFCYLRTVNLPAAVCFL
jgi:hypothetical protein